MCSPDYEEGKKSSICWGGSSAKTEAKNMVLQVFPTGLWDAFFLYTGLHSLRNFHQGPEDYGESCIL